MRLFGVSLGLLTALAFAGCGGPPVDPPPHDPVYSPLEIGGGEADGSSGFVDLVDGQDRVLVPGAQGGFHVYVNVRVGEQSMNVDRALYIDRKARREDTGQLVSQNVQLSSFVESTEAGFFDTERSMLMFLCPAPAGIQIFDTTLVLKVQARLDHNKESEPIAEGTIRVTPRCPEDMQREFCLRICSGGS